MVDMFSLNFIGPSHSTMKHDNKKGVQFISGEHREVFQSVADIYKAAMDHHGLQAPIPVLLVEDKTKIKVRVCWEHRLDALTGFCRSKEDHICISTVKVVLGKVNQGTTESLTLLQLTRLVDL